MMKMHIREFRQRFDADLCKEIVEMCVKKKNPLVVFHGDKCFYSSMLFADLKGEEPYLILDSLIPTDQDKLAKGRSEVGVTLDFILKGIVYHVRFHLLLYGVAQHEGMKAILSTPLLDLKIKTEGFTGKPSIENPLWVKIPLFKDEIKAEVKLVSAKGVMFEDRLIVDMLSALSKYKRIHLDFGDEEISVPGKYSSSGETKVEFHFGNLNEKDQQRLYEYVEQLWNEHGKKEKTGKINRTVKTKQGSDQPLQKIPVLILSADDQYVNCMKAALDEKGVTLVAEGTVEACTSKLLEYPWKLLLVDSVLEGLDLWDFTRHVQKAAEGKEQGLPLFAVLSKEVTEDAVVYAQYAGFKHIFKRDDFCEKCGAQILSLFGTGDKSSGLPIILVIDDDKNITFPLEHALGMEGFKPIIARTGSEGVRYAKDHPPSCIVLEPAIRTRDGMNAARILKRMPFTKNIPLIILTVIKERKEIDMVTQLGVASFLIKPVETPVIVEKIVEICGR